MEPFPTPTGGLNKSPSTSTSSSHRRSSRASSSPVERCRTLSGESMSTPSPRPRSTLTADMPTVPLGDQHIPPVPHNFHHSRGLNVERPSLKRFHSTGPTRHYAAQSPPSSSQDSTQSSRGLSPSRPQGNTESSLFLYPPRGDSKKRAASLDDLPHSAPNIDIPSFPLPLDSSAFLSSSTIVSTPSSHKTVNRVSQYGKQRWHALMELVQTEEAYVKDLKILVRIYLGQLHLVTALDLDAQKEIARDADALLQLHKKIYRRLNRIIIDDRIKELKGQTSSPDAERKLSEAIDRVAAVFVKEASSFHLYESFCAGHSQALDLIRQVQGLPEWDMYEKRCAVILVDELANGGDGTASPDVQGTPTSTLDTFVRPLKSRRHSTDVAPTFASSLSRTSRLAMQDFLIAPIQRVCRYPLMLSQLQPNMASASPPASPTLTNSGVARMTNTESGLEARALDAMRQVAAKVDEAQKRTEATVKSRLVAERTSEQGIPHLSSFGDCLLAGSLDVLYYHEVLAPLETPVKVKYLGAFLYGGWMLLVKVHKNRVYEPKHWFPLSSVSLTEISDEDALLPASFRLSCGDHHFEFVAACPQEKALWTKQLRLARTKFGPQSNELPSSLEEVPPKPPTPPISMRPLSLRPASRRNTNTLQPSPVSDYVLVNPPARQSSIGALENDELLQLATAGLAFIASTETPTSPVMPDFLPPIPTPVQMKNLLEGDVSTILIRRASPNHRRMVDQSLHGVYFEECQSIRLSTQMKTPLFQPPKFTSESGAITARNKMTRRESVLVKRERSVVDVTALHSSNSTPKGSLTRNKSAGVIGSKELRRRTLAFPPFGAFEGREENRNRQRPGTADSTMYLSPPGTPTAATNPDFDDQLTFQTRRKRMSHLGNQPSEGVGHTDEMGAIRTVMPTDSNVLKELPPLPASINRRSTFKLPTSWSTDDKSRFSLVVPKPRPVDRRYSSGTPTGGVYAIGEGLSNVEPVDSPRSSISNIHPGAFIRKSLTLLASKRPKRAGGYVAGLFNRSSIHVASEGDGDSSNAHTMCSEPPMPTKRLSASTPALQPLFQEPLSDWEVLPNGTPLGHADARRVASEAFPVPPLPPLPRHAHTLGPSKSTLRRRSSQMMHRLSTLTNTSNRDS